MSPKIKKTCLILGSGVLLITAIVQGNIPMIVAGTLFLLGV